MITKPRNVDWQTKLLDVIEEESTAPFEWGTHDCCTFAARCIDAQYGTSFLLEFEGEYKTELESKRLCIRKFGTTFLPKIFDRFLHRRDSKKQVQRGDVVIFSGKYGPTAGVWWGGMVVAKSKEGLIWIDFSDVEVLDVWGL
ncbi:DUF6950 family protein [Escherichia coli]|uniref:DUF6950 family protein n=1 Tax=Escherichia coli TaxID=562 RepID=UPI000CFB4C79|nr:hypothetical protein [Escherichia coli]